VGAKEIMIFVKKLTKPPTTKGFKKIVNIGLMSEDISDKDIEISLKF
jgi:hypothetical protein